MITPAYSITAQQTVSPKLNLDFTSASLDARVTFARTGNTATVINSSGYVVDIAAGVPRFDHNPVTLACRGLLIEEARTNLVSSSESFATWAAVNVSAATDTTVAPDNSTLAQKIIPSVINATHLYQLPNIFVADGNRRFWSVYVKNGGYRYAAIGPRTFASTTAYCVFDTDAGIFTHSGSSTFTADLNAVQMPNGWWRILFSSNAGSVSDDNFNIGISIDGTAAGVTFAGNGTDGIYAWGAQVELGAFLTSYIPTAGSQVTRSADIATMTGTNFSDWYNAPKGTFRIDASNVTSSVRPVISADDNTANESLVIVNDVSTPKFIVTDGGSEQANVSAGTISSNVPMFAYASYDTSFFGIARPTARQVDTSGTIPTVDRLRIGANQAGAHLNGHIQKIGFWN